MEPMKPMEPMEPMAPMKPMAAAERWWPDALGEPGSSGSQNGMRYAFFPASKRLLLQRDGAIEQYDTGEHRIQGVSQASDQAGGEAAFSSESGAIALSSLKKIGAD